MSRSLPSSEIRATETNGLPTPDHNVRFSLPLGEHDLSRANINVERNAAGDVETMSAIFLGSDTVEITSPIAINLIIKKANDAISTAVKLPTKLIISKKIILNKAYQILADFVDNEIEIGTALSQLEILFGEVNDLGYMKLTEPTIFGRTAATPNSTLLHYTTDLNCNVEILKFLLRKGADVNAVLGLLPINGEGNVSPLHAAASCDNADYVKILLQNGANPNIVTNLGYTPLFLAIVHNKLEAAKELIACERLDINFSPIIGGNMLNMAILFNRSEIIDLILKRSDFKFQELGSLAQQLNQYIFSEIDFPFESVISAYKTIFNKARAEAKANNSIPYYFNNLVKFYSRKDLEPSIHFTLANDAKESFTFLNKKDQNRLYLENLELASIGGIKDATVIKFFVLRNEVKIKGYKPCLEISKRMTEQGFTIDLESIFLIKAASEYEEKTSKLLKIDFETLIGQRSALKTYASKQISNEELKKFASIIEILKLIDPEQLSAEEKILLSRIANIKVAEKIIEELKEHCKNVFNSIQKITSKDKDVKDRAKTEISNSCNEIEAKFIELNKIALSGIKIEGFADIKASLSKLFAKLKLNGFKEECDLTCFEAAKEVAEVEAKFKAMEQRFVGQEKPDPTLIDAKTLQYFAESYAKNKNDPFCQKVIETIHYKEIKNHKTKAKYSKKLTDALNEFEGRSDQEHIINYAIKKGIPYSIIVKFIESSNDSLYKAIFAHIGSISDSNSVASFNSNASKASSLAAAGARNGTNKLAFGVDAIAEEDEIDDRDVTEFEPDSTDESVESSECEASNNLSKENLKTLRAIYEGNFSIVTTKNLPNLMDNLGFKLKTDSCEYNFKGKWSKFNIKSPDGVTIGSHKIHAIGVSAGRGEFDINFMQALRLILEEENVFTKYLSDEEEGSDTFEGDLAASEHCNGGAGAGGYYSNESAGAGSSGGGEYSAPLTFEELMATLGDA